MSCMNELRTRNCWLVGYGSSFRPVWWAGCLVSDQMGNLDWNHIDLQYIIMNSIELQSDLQYTTHDLWNQCIMSMPHIWLSDSPKHFWASIPGKHPWYPLHPIGYSCYWEGFLHLKIWHPKTARWGRRLWSYGFLFGHRHPLAPRGGDFHGVKSPTVGKTPPEIFHSKRP